MTSLAVVVALVAGVVLMNRQFKVMTLRLEAKMKKASRE